jgi:hypothetical protein
VAGIGNVKFGGFTRVRKGQGVFWVRMVVTKVDRVYGAEQLSALSIRAKARWSRQVAVTEFVVLVVGEDGDARHIMSNTRPSHGYPRSHSF